MGTRNASPSAFGWDFQINAAIFLMIENIKDADKVRVEGEDEDIEIYLKDKTKIYSQAKSVVKPDDYSNVNEKLSAALETLNLAAQNEDGILFTYVTNSSNPFNSIKTLQYFQDVTHLKFSELPALAQKKITEIIRKNGYTSLDTSRLDIRVIPFYGDDPKNRFKHIQRSVDDFLETLEISSQGIGTKILEIWQKDFFHNSTQIDTAITIGKDEMIWPLIVLVIEKVAADEYKKEYDEEEIEELNQKYKLIINSYTLRYDFVTKIITDYIKSGLKKKQFIDNCWDNYVDVITADNMDKNEKETLIKIIIYKIITKREYINNIKKGVNL